MTDRPNILFLWTDEQRWDTIAAAADNPRIHTPHLDALTRQSLCFERAYVAQPVCTPSRGTIMTGLWPHQHGATRNNRLLPGEVPVHAELLPQGYRCAYYGKWHLGDEVFAQHGFEDWASVEDMYAAHFSDERDRDAVSSYNAWLRELGYEPDQGHHFSRGFTTRLPPEHCKPAFLAERAEAFLAADDERPFLLHVNFLEPHSPLNGPYNEHYPEEAVPIAESWYRRQDEDRPLRYRHKEGSCREGQVADEATVRRQARAYWGLVKQFDDAVGRILAALRAGGRDRNTIVVFTSDHGNQLGAHGLLYKGVLYEESVRVPWLLRLPDGAHAGERVRCPVSHIDLVPTLLDYAGAEIPADLPGRSLRRVIEGEEADAGSVVAEWNPGADGTDHDEVDAEMRRLLASHERMLISPDRWKLVLLEHEPGLLFDLVHDPGELRNRFHDPVCRQRREAMITELRTWQQRTADAVALRAR